MRTLRTLAEMMKADVRERTRSYSFLVTIAATLYLVYLVSDGTIGVRISNCLPVSNSAWMGMSMALCTVTFVCLVGFYVIKNAIERDRETGVGQILAGTPVSTTLYMTGKLLSNFAVLAMVTGILALCAIFLQLFHGGGLDVPVLVSPFVFLALPAMFFTAGLAVFFESVKLLRGGFGNILFFFLFSALIVIPMESRIEATDVFGMHLAIENIQDDVRAVMPDYDGGFSIGSGTGKSAGGQSLVWEGLSWTPGNIGLRALPVAYGLLLALAGAGLFDRFSSVASAKKRGRFRRFLDRGKGSALGRIPGWVIFPFETLLRGSATGRILTAELRLMIQGQAWWWYIVALGLWIASAAMETEAARAGILPFLALWPALLWSGMGTREKSFRTGGILFSAPRPLARQLPATWAAGFIVALAFDSGILLRLALDGNGAGALAIIAGAAFIPSLALALGVWSGTSKTFEAMYVAFWYIGPAHHTASIDFLATTDAAIQAGTPVFFAVAGAALAAAALAGRWRQIAGA